MSLCSKHSNGNLKERVVTTSNFCPVCDLIRMTRDKAYERAAREVDEWVYTVILTGDGDDEGRVSQSMLDEQRRSHVEVILALRDGK